MFQFMDERRGEMVNWEVLFVEYWSTIWIAFFETFDPPRRKDQKYGSERNRGDQWKSQRRTMYSTE